MENSVVYSYEDYRLTNYIFPIITIVVGSVFGSVCVLSFLQQLSDEEKRNVTSLLCFLSFFLIGVIITICKGIIPLIRRGVIINKESKYDSTYVFGQIEEVRINSKWTGFRYYPGLLDRSILVPIRSNTVNPIVNQSAEKQGVFSKESIVNGLYGADIKIKDEWYFIISPKWFHKEDVVRIEYLPHSKCILKMCYQDKI